MDVTSNPRIKVAITGFHELPHVACTFQILSKQDGSAPDGHFVFRVILINVTTLELQTTTQGQDQLSSGRCMG
jgi:hypothetical protein